MHLLHLNMHLCLHLHVFLGGNVKPIFCHTMDVFTGPLKEQTKLAQKTFGITSSSLFPNTFVSI